MGGGGGCGCGDGDGDGNLVLPCQSPPLAEVTLALVGKIGTGKSATANCILGTHAFASEFAYVSVTETCQKSSATFHDGYGATRTVNVIDTPGLFDMEISIEDARKEIVKCIDMSKDGIHAMLIVFSATSRFSCEEQNTVESIKRFFGDKIVNHIILVFTHGDAVGDDVAWKKMLAVRSPVYLQDMIKLCQNRVFLFDNMTSNIERREMQRRKLLDAVDFVISSNGGTSFSYKMLPHIQEANDGQSENSTGGYSAERIYEQLTQITKKVDENLNSTEEEIQRLKERLEKSQKEHDNVKQEMTNAENLRRLEEQKMEEQKVEINNLREELEKARQVEMERKEKEIQRLMESLDLANKEKDNYRTMYGNKCIVM
ncbi:immune-associated nucleotide-binding protein 9-like [Triticum urartu]|uniref:immune-associated nucleotide-binding protein 9-like n=1 Tax=Triticum urartu TaxID=4572 RepID=UPI00204381AB|nr:immune-associated nucleotide-binding protein 9-like [Triticum urartu]